MCDQDYGTAVVTVSLLDERLQPANCSQKQSRVRDGMCERMGFEAVWSIQ